MDSTRMLGPGDGFDDDGQEPERGHNPLLTLHLILQGRYWIAIIAAIAFALAGALIGFRSQQILWATTGTVHIRPVLSQLLFDKGSGTMPMYESFVQTQIGYIKSERCINIAMSSPQWLTGPTRSNSDEARANFIQHLEVIRDGEFIHVTYADPDPKTSTDAVLAVVNAYQGLVSEVDPENAAKRIPQLQALQAEFDTRLTNAKTKIAEAASPLTPDRLQDRYTYKSREVLEAETQLSQSNQALETFLRVDHPELAAAVATRGAGTQPTSSQPAASQPAAAAPAAASRPAEPVVYTAKQIAATGDPQMRALQKSLDDAQADLDATLMSVGPNHPLAVLNRNRVALITGQIEKYVSTWQPRVPTSDTGAGPGEMVVSPFETLQRLQSKVIMDKERLASVSTELQGLEKQVKDVNAAESNVQQLQGWVDETKQKLEEARLDNAASGRIETLSTGDMPVKRDHRFMFGAVGGFGGMIVGFGLVLVLSLMDRRLRTIDQARMSLKQGMRVLGMLPSLPKNLEDPSAAAFAALCVHHIRMLLQVMPRLDGHPAIAVTSPSPGDGKTSLTLALALSYAASGRSTLLIDCDIVGAGLTRRVNALIRRRIGQILIRENLITPVELREALTAAQRSGRKLGEVLVDEGYVDADQLAKALKLQGETSVGLLDVMRGELLEDCVADTGTPRLWILPVGSAMAEHGATISPEGFRTVLDQARKRFEVVLVDTGPIPGSIESSVACSQVDGVVMTVSRGEQGPLVKRASEHLRDIGARALGIVFNRAKPEDFSSSYGSMSSPSIPERVRDKPGMDTTAFGPVASAVAGQQKSLNE